MGIDNPDPREAGRRYLARRNVARRHEPPQLQSGQQCKIRGSVAHSFASAPSSRRIADRPRTEGTLGIVANKPRRRPPFAGSERMPACNQIGNLISGDVFAPDRSDDAPGSMMAMRSQIRCTCPMLWSMITTPSPLLRAICTASETFSVSLTDKAEVGSSSKRRVPMWTPGRCWSQRTTPPADRRHSSTSAIEFCAMPGEAGGYLYTAISRIRLVLERGWE